LEQDRRLAKPGPAPDHVLKTSELKMHCIVSKWGSALYA